MKIVLPDASTVTNGDLSLDVFEKYGETTIYPLTEQSMLAERICDAEAVFCNKSIMSREIIMQAKNLRYIGLFATGYNNVDLEAATERGIVVSNAGAYSTDAVAQHVFALILHQASKISAYDSFVKSGGWQTSAVFSPIVFPMTELAGKTIGIIGFGSIGRRVSEIAKAFSMRVLAYSRSPKTAEGVTFLSLSEVLANSDFVTMHLPLTKETDKMCNREFFSFMKKGAYFINTSRGGVVDATALKEALVSEKLSGAAIDVLEKEPMPMDSLYMSMPNVTVTPHVAWAPLETRQRLLQIVEENFIGFLEGKPKNQVNR